MVNMLSYILKVWGGPKIIIHHSSTVDLVQYREIWENYAKILVKQMYRSYQKLRMIGINIIHLYTKS